MKVKLTYFKPGGKYYGGGEYNTNRKYLNEIWDEVREFRKKDELPGIISGKEFIILIEVPEHMHNHPRLINPYSGMINAMDDLVRTLT